ncbi:hypothetical protein DRN76_01000, partial [Methanosarcinales archaeon]
KLRRLPPYPLGYAPFVILLFCVSSHLFFR